MLDIKEVLNYARLSTAEAGSSPVEATLIMVRPPAGRPPVLPQHHCEPCSA